MYTDSSYSPSSTDFIEMKAHKDPTHLAGKRSGIRCLYTNTDCLQNKLELLELFVHDNNIDVIAITETLVKFVPAEDQLNTNFILPGYTNLNKNSGRGVCLFVKNNLNVTRMEDCEALFDTSVCCKISLNKDESFMVVE